MLSNSAPMQLSSSHKVMLAADGSSTHLQGASPREIYQNLMPSAPQDSMEAALSDWYTAQAVEEAMELECPRLLVHIDESYVVHPTSARSRAAQDDPLFFYYEAQAKRATSQSQLRRKMVPCKVDEMMVVEPHFEVVFRGICA
jgi:hypothetical protein